MTEERIYDKNGLAIGWKKENGVLVWDNPSLSSSNTPYLDSLQKQMAGQIKECPAKKRENSVGLTKLMGGVFKK